MATQTGSNFIKDKSNEFGQNRTAPTFDRDREENKEDKSVPSLLNTASEKVSELGPTARNLADKAKGIASDAYANVGEMIEKNPTQSFLVGLGVGCILGAAVTSLIRR